MVYPRSMTKVWSLAGHMVYTSWYSVWLTIWIVKPMNGNNFALRVTLFVPSDHQGVKYSLGINLAGHMSCWTGKGQQYDFRLTLNLSEGQIVSWYKLGCPYELLNQWMATVWSPADSKLVRESNYLEVQALAGHMNCKPMNGNSVVFGWLYIVSESYFFGVGNQALSWARFATDKSDKKLI